MRYILAAMLMSFNSFADITYVSDEITQKIFEIWNGLQYPLTQYTCNGKKPQPNMRGCPLDETAFYQHNEIHLEYDSTCGTNNCCGLLTASYVKNNQTLSSATTYACYVNVKTVATEYENAMYVLSSSRDVGCSYGSCDYILRIGLDEMKNIQIKTIISGGGWVKHL